MTIKEYKFEFNLVNGNDTYDRFYGAFDLMFDICAHLVYNRDNDYPIHHWKYKSIADDTSPESYWYELIDETDTQTLIYLGNLLNRYIKYLEFKGYEV